MEDILNELYFAYNQLLNDLSIGHNLSSERLDYLWDLIHKLYFIKHENYSNIDIVKLLEYYEYL